MPSYSEAAQSRCIGWTSAAHGASGGGEGGGGEGGGGNGEGGGGNGGGDGATETSATWIAVTLTPITSVRASGELELSRRKALPALVLFVVLSVKVMSTVELRQPLSGVGGVEGDALAA